MAWPDGSHTAVDPTSTPLWLVPTPCPLKPADTTVPTNRRFPCPVVVMPVASPSMVSASAHVPRGTTLLHIRRAAFHVEPAPIPTAAQRSTWNQRRTTLADEPEVQPELLAQGGGMRGSHPANRPALRPSPSQAFHVEQCSQAGQSDYRNSDLPGPPCAPSPQPSVPRGTRRASAAKRFPSPSRVFHVEHLARRYRA